MIENEKTIWARCTVCRHLVEFYFIGLQGNSHGDSIALYNCPHCGATFSRATLTRPEARQWRVWGDYL